MSTNSNAWSREKFELAKDVLRDSDSIHEAILKLKKKGVDVSSQSLALKFKKRSLPGPYAYLNQGIPAAKRGDHPGHKGNARIMTPPGYRLAQTTTLYDADGDEKLTWVRVKEDNTETLLEDLRSEVHRIAEPFKGLSKIGKKPIKCVEDLLATYVFGDVHFGMFSWHEETGEDFDVAIAEKDLFGAVDYLVDSAPAAKEGLIVNLGDFFHSDNYDNRTMRSGNALDVDGRFPKVLGLGLKLMRRCIERALDKHETVRVINAIGNHDDHTAIVLGLTLNAYFENNPRVTVDLSPAAHHYYRFGKVLLGVTHGHTTKPAKLQGVMATDQAEDWGQTLYRHWLTGHVHHDQKKEFEGCTFESFRTLTARDSYAASHGYRSDRDMKCIVYHKEYGESMRLVANIRCVRDFRKTR